MEHWSNYIVPVFLMTLKLVALVVCGYYAIKWHFDEEKRVKAREAKEKKAKNSLT